MSDSDEMSRRAFLKSVGSFSTALASGLILPGRVLADGGGNPSCSSSSGPRQPTVDLDDGESIKPVLQEIDDGDHEVLPRGDYVLEEDVTVSAADWSVDGNGSTIEIIGPRLMKLRGQQWGFCFFNWDVTGYDQVTIHANGSDWRIHNLAWSGKNKRKPGYPDDGPVYNKLISPAIDRGSSAEIAECWFGEGLGPDTSESAITCWAGMDGPLWIRRCYFYQNGVYGANSSSDGKAQKGVTHFDRCYFENTYLAGLRTGSTHHTSGDNRATVRDSTLVYDSWEETPEVQSSGQQRARSIWAYHGPVEVRDCQIWNELDNAFESSQDKGSPTIYVRGGDYTGDQWPEEDVDIGPRVGNDPRKNPPKDCVQSPEEAYLGDEARNSGRMTCS